jgi:PAS domain S-box-containing protein
MSMQGRHRLPVVHPAIETLLWLAVVALVSWLAHQLQTHGTPAALFYVCVVVLVSLRGSLIPALLVSVAATVVWDQVFRDQLITPAQREWRDGIMLAALCGIAVMITRFVQAVRTSDARWRNAFENNPTMYFMVDPAGTVLSVNPFGAEQLGYTVAELVGQPVLNVFLDDDKAAAREHVERCLAHLGQSLSWELRKVRKDGSMLWVRETARAVRLDARPPVVLVACEDITERREAEDRLRENEARLRGQANLLDLTHDTIFVRDANDVVVYWNRGAEESYGWTREEALGHVSHELMKTSFPEPLADITATLLRTGRWEGELVHTKRDGTRTIVASRWSLQRDSEGRPTGVLETNNDISERRRAEEQLRRSETYLAEAQRLSHTGSFGWDVDTGAVTWSEETYRIFGVDPGTPVGIDVVLQRTHPEDRADVRATVERAQHALQDFEHEYRLLRPDGSIRHLHVVARAVRDESGRHEFVGAVMDVTERERAAAALERAQTELSRVGALTTMGELAASIAHELRQPLAAIVLSGSAALRWLDREHPDIGEARDAARRTVEEAQRAEDVIRGLRGLVGHRALRRARLDLNDTIHEVLNLVRGELRRSDVVLHAELPPTLRPVFGDRVQLQQVLLNLIVNGIDAMRPVLDRPRELTLRTESVGPDGVAVVVEDCGTGIEAEAIDRIFDPFFTTKAEGLGMGLAICRSIVEAHGGTLSASPHAPHGTAFRFTLPFDRTVRDGREAGTPDARLGSMVPSPGRIEVGRAPA